MDYVEALSDYFKDDEKNLSILDKALNFATEKTKSLNCNLTGLFDLESFLAIRPDISSVVSAVISPIYESELISEEEIINNFGKEVFEIVDAIKKIHSLKFEENDEKSQLDALRKLFVIMAKNIRVVFVALAQRLYVMQNLSQIRVVRDKMMIAKETLQLYVPVAGRLGVYRMKTTLEDLSFKYIYEKEFNEIEKELEVFGKSKSRIIAILKRKLEDICKDFSINAEVSGRIKSVYSIHKKLQKKNLNNLADLYDIFAVRVIVDHGKDFDTEEDISKLYFLLGEIHNRWSPLPHRFKDYLANPKPNGYKSIHTIVLGLLSKEPLQPVEIQIRTKVMHNEAEYGVAAHWLYKNAGSDPENEKVKAHSNWLKEIQKINSGDMSGDFSVFKDRIFVLTPRGEIKDLPVGATPIDFAYSVHTELGHRAYLAKVSDKVVPLNYPLKNGDVVYITTNPSNTPKLEWLSFVKTPLAKSTIKAYFNAMNVDFYLKEGKKAINKQLELLSKDFLDQNYSVLKDYNRQNLTLEEREKLIIEVGKGSQQAGDVIRKVFPSLFEVIKKKDDFVKKVNHEERRDLIDRIVIGGESNLPLKIAKCCNPKYGDEIVAYFKKATMLTTVHKKTCKHLKNLDEKRLMTSEWK
ncbi:MAG: HD domain-containing protein [Candidatus Gracilibacteria bacterium]|jgi:GTP pyrophosphokinase|nr:HD domain-containing protein [Candidatus Gracilibacteria bacterium]